MTNWKSLHLNPPRIKSNICVKVGSNYETYLFCPYQSGWELQKGVRTIPPERIPLKCLYILLDEIK